MVDLSIKLNSIIENAENSLTGLKEIQDLVDKKFNEYEDRIKTLEKELKLSDEKDKEFKKISKENEKLKAELDDINTQMNKISKLYREVSQRKEEAIDVKKLLSIYVVLLEQVFDGRPHAKILFLLHGDNQTLARESITKATGFQPAVVLHSIHDLNNAELVMYDNEKDVITLKQKIY